MSEQTPEIRARGGPRIVVPPGTSVVSMIEENMANGGEQMSSEEASKLVGISEHTYSYIRKLLILQSKDLLTPEERDTITRALAIIDEEKRLRGGRMLANHLVKKYWEPKTKFGVRLLKHEKLARGRVYKRNRKQHRKLEKGLENTLFFLKQLCFNSDEMTLPQLTEQAKRKAVDELQECVRSLCNLIHRVKEGDDSHED